MLADLARVLVIVTMVTVLRLLVVDSLQFRASRAAGSGFHDAGRYAIESVPLSCVGSLRGIALEYC